MDLQYHIDIGQIIIAALVFLATSVGWFIKLEITNFGKRLDKHETVISNMTTTLSEVVGSVSVILKMFGESGIHFHGRSNDRDSDIKDKKV